MFNSARHRIEKFAQFKDLRARIVVATNLLGRGIDVERINVVINYDMPTEADTYLHRVGRAGRFGTKGLAISFVSAKEDGEVLNKVQSLFVVNIPELKPGMEIPKSSYSTLSLPLDTGYLRSYASFPPHQCKLKARERATFLFLLIQRVALSAKK